MPPAQLSRLGRCISSSSSSSSSTGVRYRASVWSGTPTPLLCRLVRGGGSIALSTQPSSGSLVAGGSACRCATRLPTPNGTARHSPGLVHVEPALARHRSYSLFGGGDGDEHRRNATRYTEQRSKLDAVQADSTWWWQRQRNNVFLAYIIHSNDEFDIEEFTEGAGFAFKALNTAMYCGEPVTEETFHGMAHNRIGRILSGVMQDYAKDGVHMLPTAGEPSGYDLHSVKISRLAVREIAEIDVDHDNDNGAVSENNVQPKVDDPRQEPMSAVERGTENFKHTPMPSTIVKEPTYTDIQRKHKQGENDKTDSNVDETAPEFIEYACIDVEYKATETFTMVGADGKVLDGSDVPRERTIVYTIRGRLDQGEDFDWEIFDMPQLG